MVASVDHDIQRIGDECIAFLSAIFEPDDIIEFVSMYKRTVHKWASLESILEIVPRMLRANVDEHAFFGCNPRTKQAEILARRRDQDRRAGKQPKPVVVAEEVALCRCLCIDIDKSLSGDDRVSHAEANQRIADANLPSPTVILSTGGGIHAYWRLDEPITDLALWTGHQAALSRLLNCDGTIKNANRIMRLPGFVNVKPKYPDRPVCRTLDLDVRRVYPLFEFPAPIRVAERPKQTGPVQPRSMAKLTRRFLDDGYVPATIASRRATMFTVACDLKARDWSLDDATEMLMKRMRQVGLDDDDIADCPRQIANAYAKPREPLAGDDEEVEIPESHVDAPAPAPTVEILTALDLIERHPEKRPEIVHGLLREGETMNMVASPKTGKSLLVTDLALAVAGGSPWLGTYGCRGGRVLIVDNELHPETMADRLRDVANARDVSDDVLRRINVLPLRGQLQTIHQLTRRLDKAERGTWDVIVLDAFYRFLPAETDENSNAAIASIYNIIDQTADKLGAAMVCIHHTSKGIQSGKGITDVGAGAGSQSRAVDTHVVLRPHEEPEAVVFEAVTRSFRLPAARVFRRRWPVFERADDLDPTLLLKEFGKRKKRDEGDRIDAGSVRPWDAERVLDEIVGQREVTRESVIADIKAKGLTERRARDLWTEIKAELVPSGSTPDSGGKAKFCRRGLNGDG